MSVNEIICEPVDARICIDWMKIIPTKRPSYLGNTYLRNDINTAYE